MRAILSVLLLLLAACEPQAQSKDGVLVLEVSSEELQAADFRGLSKYIRDDFSEPPVISLNSADGPKVVDDHLAIQLTDAASVAAATERIKKLGGEYDVTDAGNGALQVRPSAGHVAYIRGAVLSSSADMVEKRAQHAWPSAAAERVEEQIIVRFTGLADQAKLDEIAKSIGIAGVVSFNLVDEAADPASYEVNVLKDGRVVRLFESQGGEPAVLVNDPIATGGAFADAGVAFDRDKRPSIRFKLRDSATDRFAKVTSENVGRQFAIVFNEKIIAAPYIRSPITTGEGTIEGNFTVEEAERIAQSLLGSLIVTLNVVSAELQEARPQP
jgi:preprotein translocase subunit SecD